MSKEILELMAKTNHNINPFYIKITKSITYGYFLSQLEFLYRSFGCRQFYRTDLQLKSYYHLTQKEIINARKRLVTLGFLKTRKRREGGLYYTLNIEKLYQLWLEYKEEYKSVENSENKAADYAQREESIMPKGQNGIMPKGHNVYKEDNDQIKQIIKNDLNEKHSVDNFKEDFVVRKEQERDLDFERKKFFSLFTSKAVYKISALRAVVYLDVYVLQDIFNSYAHQNKGKKIKNSSAYLTGCINKALKTKLETLQQEKAHDLVA